MIQLTKNDFQPFGQVAKHCNNEKLQIAINEAIQFDLKPLLCGLFFFVDENWTDEDNDESVAIIHPNTYEGCGGNTMSHQGLKTVLTYYSYARYLIINNLDDTPNGGVTKTNEWSIPKPYSDLKQVSERYRNMGLDLFKEVEAYICLNRDDYPEAISFISCQPCGCNGKCGQKTKNKGFGIRGTNVTRRI